METLGDYIKSGRHELVAFVNSLGSINNQENTGNLLGKTYLGILVCDRKYSEEGSSPHLEKVEFIYPCGGRWPSNSNIARANFYYNAEIVNRVPLSLTVSFSTQNWINRDDHERLKEATGLLSRYGIPFDN